MARSKKPARNFGGRPVERTPASGAGHRRAHLNIAVPAVLKQALEREAAKHGRSVSAEATYRLDQSFVWLAAVKSFERLTESLVERIKQLEKKEEKNE